MRNSGRWLLALSAVSGVVALEHRAEAQMFLVGQTRWVAASAFDATPVRIDAPGFDPFLEIVRVDGPFNASWSSATQSSRLGAFELSVTGSTAGGRSGSFIPYPSSTCGFIVTFDLAAANVFRLRATCNFTTWSLTGPSFNLRGIPFTNGLLVRGTLPPGRYVFDASTTLEHMAGMIFPTDMSFRLGVSPCEADLDDGTNSGVSNGSVGMEDLLFYLGQYVDGGLEADYDDGSGTGTPDGGVGIEDLLYYLQRYDAGC